MCNQLKIVFANIHYTALAGVIAGVVFTLSIWLPNIQLIGAVLFSSSASFVAKMQFLMSLYAGIGTNFTLVSATYTILIALLFGINIALLVYYIKKVGGHMPTMNVTSAAGVGGLVSGVFGIGCAACGTFILTSVLTLFGAGGLVVFLPFGGEEFGFLGVGLLGYSIYTLLKKIQAPLVCPV